MTSGDRFVSKETHPGARFLFVAACLVIVIWGVKMAEPILVPVCLALFLAILSLPIVTWLRAKKIPGFVAIFLAVAINLAIVTGVVLLTIESVSELEATLKNKQGGQGDYVHKFEELRGNVVGFAEEYHFPAADLLEQQIFDPKALFGVLQSAARQMVELFSKAFLVFLIIIFMLAEATHIPAKLREIGHDESMINRLKKIAREVLHYLMIKTLTSAVTGLLVWIAMSFVGLDFPVLWGLMAFVLNYIPTVGSILAAIPAIILGLIQMGWGSALSIGFIYLVINVIIGNFVDPTLLGRQMGLSTLVVILSLVFWGWVWGPIGMLLAVPLTMVVRIMLENTRDFRWVAVLLSKWPMKADGGALMVKIL